MVSKFYSRRVLNFSGSVLYNVKRVVLSGTSGARGYLFALRGRGGGSIFRMEAPGGAAFLHGAIVSERAYWKTITRMHY